jgi:hypothetical protein
MPFESFFHSSYRNNLSFAKLIWQNFILKKFDCEAENCKKVVSGCKKVTTILRRTVLRIRHVYPGSDFFPSRIPDPNFFHPGSTSKNLNILTPKNFLSSRKYDTGCSSRIRNLIFYPSRIRDPQYCRRIIFLFSRWLRRRRTCPRPSPHPAASLSGRKRRTSSPPFRTSYIL